MLNFPETVARRHGATAFILLTCLLAGLDHPAFSRGRSRSNNNSNQDQNSNRDSDGNRGPHQSPPNPYAVTLTGIRAINGSNSGVQPSFGAADTELLRIGPSAYPGDGTGDEIIVAPRRANPRTISNTVAAQSGSIPNDRNMSDFIWAWGQFLDHDIDLTFTDDAAGFADIEIEDPADILGPNPIPFSRSEFVVNPVNGQREHLNAITAYIDASNVYGSSTPRETALREFAGGRLRVGADDLLPFNDVGLNNAPSPSSAFFLAGDIRANENVVLTSLHTLFVREHNRLANLIALHDPQASDEQVYQLARKIVGAEMQRITYQEFLPALLGPQAPQLSEGRSRPRGNPGIATEFSTAFYRIGHTMLSSQLQLREAGGGGSSLPLKDAFFRPSFLSTDPLNVDRLLSGLQTQAAQEIDTQIVDDVRNFLFGPPGAGGLDLASLNIQRGRDHGLADYNALRSAYGLRKVRRFVEVTRDSSLRSNLEALYVSPDNIDAWVGSLAEPHAARTSVGPLMLAALRDQFLRTLKGDLFNAVSDPDLDQPLVQAIVPLSTIKLADIIRMNTTLASVADDTFSVAAPIETDVVATYDRSTNRLIVVGNRAANRLHISQLTRNTVLLTGLDGTRINGNPAVLTKTSRLPHVTIDLGAGDDELHFLFGEFGDACVSTGSGDDTVDAAFTTVQNLVYDDGDGNDSLTPPSGIPVASR